MMRLQKVLKRAANIMTRFRRSSIFLYKNTYLSMELIARQLKKIIL